MAGIINILRADTEFSDNQALVIGSLAAAGVIAASIVSRLTKPSPSDQNRNPS
jgi:hypothetical protein